MEDGHKDRALVARSAKLAARKGMVSASGREITIEEDESGRRLRIEVSGSLGIVQLDVIQGRTVIDLYEPRH